MDTDRLKTSFSEVARHGDSVPAFFYGYLFIRAPELRDLFPTSMAAQRDKLVTALGTVVSNVDAMDELVPFVRGLGRDHRKFGVLAEHYAPVGEALLATLAPTSARPGRLSWPPTGRPQEPRRRRPEQWLARTRGDSDVDGSWFLLLIGD